LAVPLLEETLKVKKAKLGVDHPDTLSGMNNLAEAYRAAGKMDLSLELFQESLRLTKTKLGNDHPYTLVVMHNLGTVHKVDGHLDQALPLLLASAVGMEKLHFQYQYADQIVADLFDCYEQMKQFDKAEIWERKSLAIVKERSGMGSVPYARALA